MTRSFSRQDEDELIPDSLEGEDARNPLDRLWDAIDPDKKPPTDFYDENGAPVTDLAMFEGQVFSTRINGDGTHEVKSWRSGADALAETPFERCVISCRKTDSLIDRLETYSSSGEHPGLSIRSRLDRDNAQLTVETEFQGERRVVTYQGGKFVGLELVCADEHGVNQNVRFTFTADGRVRGVSLSEGTPPSDTLKELSPGKAADLIGAAKSVLEKVAREYQLPYAATSVTPDAAAGRSAVGKPIAIEDLLSRLRNGGKPILPLVRRDVLSPAAEPPQDEKPDLLSVPVAKTENPGGVAAVPPSANAAENDTGRALADARGEEVVTDGEGDDGAETFFVSAELPPPETNLDIAERVFGGHGGLLNGAQELPSERQKDYEGLTFHEKTAAMVNEVLVYDNPKAFADLRREAGRQEWDGVSSAAATAYHRCCVVKAVRAYEDAVRDGDTVGQRNSLRELSKLRVLKLGTEYGAVHQAIDEYLKQRMEKTPELLTRDMIDDSRRQAMDGAALDFKKAATAFASFAVAENHQERLAAFDAFKQAALENPDPKILAYAAKLGDFVSALNLKETLNATPPNAESVVAALKMLDSNSSGLSQVLLRSVLQALKENPSTKDEFASTDRLTMDALCELLNKGKLKDLLPHLQKALGEREFTDVFGEYEKLKTSKFSPAELLRAGLPSPPSDKPDEDDKRFEEQIERARDAMKDHNARFQELERKFLARETTAEERLRLLDELKEVVARGDLITGDSATLTNTDHLEAINCALAVKDGKDPKLVAEQLEKLQRFASSGYPLAQRMMTALFPTDTTKSAETMLSRLKGDAGAAALLELQKNTEFVAAELDQMRIRNLTYNFMSDRLPSANELDELKTLLEGEQTNGNKGAADWLKWTEAAKLVVKISIGGGLKEPEKQAAIEELAALAKDGNNHARKMLLGIVLYDVNPQCRAQWNSQFNSHEGPKVLRPNLTSVDSYRREYFYAAAKGISAAYEKRSDELDRGDAFALSLAVGQSSRLDALLGEALKGRNGGEILQGVFEAIRINAPGGEHLARTILHGANRPEFAEMLSSFLRWAESGDKVGMIVLAGVLAGRRENPDLFEVCKQTILRLGGDKNKQAAVLETLLQTYKADVENGAKPNFELIEIMGDVLAKNKKGDIPEKLFNDVRDVFRKELTFLNDWRNENVPNRDKRFEHVLRGFMSFSKYMERSDLENIRVTPQLAKAMAEKNWEIPDDCKFLFKSKLFFATGERDQALAVAAFQCIGTAGKILDPYEVRTLGDRLRPPVPKDVEAAHIRCVLQIIGSASGRPEVKDAAITALEKSHWYNNELDQEVRKGLSDYVRGRVGDVRLIDRVVGLIGDCGIEPPMALVVSRLGLPLTPDLVRDVEAGMRNFGNDRAAYLKVIERAMLLNAVPPDQNFLGRPDLGGLVERMADAPLAGDDTYGYLTTDQVEKLIDGLEKLHYDVLIAKSAASGKPLTEAQIRSSVFGGYDLDRTSGGITKGQEQAYEQSVANLRQVTRDGHQTSYWWLAAGGAGYLIRRFGPGGTEAEFEKKQEQALKDWKAAQAELGKATVERDALVNGLVRLDTAKSVGLYINQLAAGNIAASDATALRILARTGPEDLRSTAPFLHAGIIGPGDKPGEIWTRLRRMHATNLESPPIFPQHGRATDEVLRFLQRPELVLPAGSRTDKYHDLKYAAHEVALSEAFRALDQDERMIATYKSFGKLSALIGSTQMLFQEGMAGHRGEAYTQLARQMGRQIQDALKELQAQAPQIRNLVRELKEARDKAVDPDAKKGLDGRIKALEDILLGYVPNSRGQTNSKRYNELQEMCRIMNSSDFDPASFGKWLTDNAGTMILVTTALAGIALIPFSGGASGILTAVAVAALVATVGYVANEVWKEGMHQFGGAAYGSDFLRSVTQLTTGLQVTHTGLRYDPQTGGFKAPPGMDEALKHAVVEIGKETLVNLIGAGFGKFIGIGLKAMTGPGRLAATEITKDTAKLVVNLEKVAASNPLAKSWGSRFVHAWASQVPWAVVGATADAVAQDSLKDLKDKNGIAEFMIHTAAVCFTVMTHRVGGHIMRPRVIGNGNVEIPYSKEAFMEAMRTEYARQGKPMPKIVMEGDVAKVSVGGRVIELRFVDPLKVAAELDKNGVRPEPLRPGEVAEPGGRLNAGDTAPVAVKVPNRPMPELDPAVHMSAAEVPVPMHPKGTGDSGGKSVLSYDRAAPVILAEPGTPGNPTTYTRGYAVAEPNGGATVIRFTETPQDSLFATRQKFQQGDQHVPIAQSDGVAYFYDSKARTVLKVTNTPEGPVAIRVENFRLTTLAAGEMGQLKPAIRTEPALKVTVDGQSMEIAGAGRRAVVIGSGSRADIRIPGLTGGVIMTTDGKGFYVRSTGGAPVEVVHADGRRTTVAANETVALRSTDKLVIGGKEVILKPGESHRYSVLPLRDMGTENRGAKPVDMVKTPAVSEIPPGFAYCEDLPGTQRVRPRVIDAARDPVLQQFEADAMAKFAHLKGNDAALMQAITDYVHERMTPRVVDEGYGGQPGVRQGRGMNNVAGRVDGNNGAPIMMGELIARRSAVCLDQAMMVKYLAQKMGVKAEVTTGTWNGQPHAWVTLTGPGGKRTIYDPRNNNQLFHNERAGLPQNRDYQPFGPDNPRRVQGRTFSGDMPTDYSSINKQIGEVKDSLDGHVAGKRIEPAQREAFMSALGESLKTADPQTLKAIGDKLGQLASAPDLPQRLAQLTEVLKDPRAARMGPAIETLLDPKMPLRNLQSLSEFMKTDAAKNAFNAGDSHAMQQFRDNLNKLAHSPELPQRLEIAKQLEGLFKETAEFRMDFVLDSNISIAKLQEFKTAMESMNKGDMVFAYPEVVQALRAAHPEAARHLVENLPEMVKKFTSAEDAVDKLTSLRMVAESCRDLNGLTQLPLLLEQKGVHLQDPAYKAFVDRSMRAGLERVLADPANHYMFTAGGDGSFQLLRTVYEKHGMIAEFNQAVRNRFESQMKNGREISAQEKSWVFKNRESLGVDQPMLERVMRYEAPVPKVQFLPGGENMTRILSEHESYKGKYTDFELAGTSNNGNHLVKCTDASGRTNYMIVQKGPSGEAVIFRVIDLEGSPIKSDPMFVKHLADLDPQVLKQMASGLYGDGSVRRPHLDLSVEVERTGSTGKAETDSVRGFGMSWRVGGGLNRTLMVVSTDANGKPVIVVVSRCSTKAAAEVDGSYKATPLQLASWKQALADAARPGWAYKPK